MVFDLRILWDMALRQLKAKYAGSYLGLWWAVIIPLLLAASINLVFTAVLRVQGPGNYGFFALSGILPWFYFSQALTEATPAFCVDTGLLRQTLVPRSFFPLASVMANGLNFLVGLAAVIPLFIWMHGGLSPALLLLVPAALLLFFFICGLAYLCAAGNVFFRDLSQVISLLLMVWFWVTPVFYAADTVPLAYRAFNAWNPATYFVVLFQKILFDLRAPSWGDFLTAAALSAGFYALGHLVFRALEPALRKRI